MAGGSCPHRAAKLAAIHDVPAGREPTATSSQDAVRIFAGFADRYTDRCRRFGGTATRSLSGADPTELLVRQQAPESRALPSDARGRRSGRRPYVCLVLSSSAGARCAVVSSNATLFPRLEHSAGWTWHRREHAPVCRLSAQLRHHSWLRENRSLLAVASRSCDARLRANQAA